MANEKKEQVIGAAVSGGADSMVMLDVLRSQHKNVAVINVDHGIRGEESVRDSEFVKRYCIENGIPIYAFRVDTTAYSRAEGISLELAARTLRYRVFERLLKRGNVHEIALAHHLNDQAETILMRLFRGTGVRGLRGIVDREHYIHPLITWTKEDIYRYAAEHKVPFVVDSTNSDQTFTRNYVRGEIVPSIEEHYPGFLRVVQKMSENFNELEDFLLQSVVPYRRENQTVRVGKEVWEKHPAVRKKTFAECLRTGMGVRKDVEFSHLEALDGLKDKESGTKINLPFAVDAYLEYGDVVFCPREERRAYLKHYSPQNEYAFGGKIYTFTVAKEMERGLTFDANKVPSDTVIRTRYPGDVFRRCGGKQKSFSDYCIDEKIPLRIRDDLLLLATGSRVLAVLGKEIAEEIKIDADTRTIYKINVRGIEECTGT